MGLNSSGKSIPLRKLLDYYDLEIFDFFSKDNIKLDKIVKYLRSIINH